MDQDPIPNLYEAIEKSIIALADTDDINERKIISETIRNLVEAMGGITELAETMMHLPDLED